MSHSAILTYILEFSLCWLIFYAIFFIFLRKITFYRANRWYLLSSLVLGLLIPLLGFLDINLVQREVMEVAPLLFYIKETPSHIATTFIDQSVQTGWNWPIQKVLAAFYLIGISVFGIRFIKGLEAIRQLYLEGIISEKQNYTLVLTDKAHLPFSFGRYLFISQDIQLSPNYNRVLTHELAHINGRHSIDVIFIELVNIVFWFHPMVYLYKTALRQTHEYLADEVVLRDTPRQLYGQILLKQSLSGIQVALAHHFFHSHIKKRINMMYQKKSGQSASLKYLLIVPVTFILITAFAQSSQKNEETDRESPLIIEQNDNGVKTLTLFKRGMAPSFDNLVDLAYHKVPPAEQKGKKGNFIFRVNSYDRYYNKTSSRLESIDYGQELLKNELIALTNSLESEGSLYVQQRANLLYSLLSYQDNGDLQAIQQQFRTYGKRHNIEFSFGEYNITDMSVSNSDISKYPRRYSNKPYSNDIAYAEIDDFIKAVGGSLRTGIDHSVLHIHYVLLLNRYPDHQWDILEVFNKYMREKFNKTEMFLPNIKPQININPPKRLLKYIDQSDPDKAPYIWIEGAINDLPLRKSVDLSKPIGRYTYLPPEKAVKVFGDKAKLGFYALYNIERPYNHPENVSKRKSKQIENFFSTFKDQDKSKWAASLKKFYKGLSKRKNDNSAYLTDVSNKAMEHGISIVFKNGEISKIYEKVNGEFIRID